MHSGRAASDLVLQRSWRSRVSSRASGPFGAHGGGGGGLVVACAALILGAIVAAGSLPQRHDDVLDQEWLALAAVPVPTVLSQPVAPPAHVQSSSPDFAMR